MNSRRSHSITSSARASSDSAEWKPERLSSLEVDDQLEFGRLLDWQVAGLCPPQNHIDIIGGASEQVWKVRSIGHQGTRFDILP